MGRLGSGLLCLFGVSCLRTISVLIPYISFLFGFREEYRPWAGVQPSKPIQKRPTFLGTAKSEAPPETSYQAAFSVDTNRLADISVPDMTTRSQPEVSSRPEVSAGIISGFPCS